MATTERAIRPGADWQSAGDYEDIRFETAEGIAKITIDRPEVRNAFRPETLIEISDALERAREDTDVGVIVLTGEGPLAFCSGGDQNVRGDSGYVPQGAAVGRFHVTDLHVQMRRLPKPIVAMVAGYAVGGGHVLHVVCDLTIAADNARFGQTGPKVGSFDGGFGAGLLAAQVGQKKAKEIWFLCRQYDAQQALDMGLVNTVVPLEELEVETVALVPRDARALAVRAAAPEGQLQRHRGRADRAPAARPRHESPLLRQRGGAGGPRRLPGEAQAGLRQVPAPPVSHLRLWLVAARPRTLPAAVAPVLVGTALAADTEDVFKPLRFAAALVGSIFIQIGTNLANDYSDARRGADTEDRLGPVRVTAGGLMPPRRVLVGHLGRVRDRRGRGRLPRGRRGLGAARGRRPLDRRGRALHRRPAPVRLRGPRRAVRVRLLRPRRRRRLVLRADRGPDAGRRSRWACPVGLLAAAILVVNNVRDIETDRRAGKRTLAVRLGRERAVSVFAAMLVLAYVALPVIWALSDALDAWLLLPLASAAARACRWRARCRARRDGPALNQLLADTGPAAGRILGAARRRPADLVVKRDLFVLSLPFREPFVTATGVISERWIVLLRLEDEDGAVGWGEAAPFEPYDGVSVERVEAVLRGALARGAAPGRGGRRDGAARPRRPPRGAPDRRARARSRSR